MKVCCCCGASLELDDRRAVAFLRCKDGDLICAACCIPADGVGGGQRLTREQVDNQVAAIERKYRAAAARGQREAP